MKAALVTAALLLATACGPKTAGEAAADNLHNAADVSDPAAARVLDNAADNVAEVTEPAAANAMTDQAMNDAAEAPRPPQ